MADQTDVLASIYLHLSSDVVAQLSKDEAAIVGFNSRVDALRVGSVASNGVAAGAGLGADTGASAATVEKLSASLNGASVAARAADADMTSSPRTWG
jgi:hypothetical protein